MREPPTGVDGDVLLAAIRREWDGRVERLVHLRLGFGAHHWAAYAAGQPTLFVTLDRVDSTRPPEDRAAAYGGAIALREAGLEFVSAPLLTASGSPTIAWFEGVVSCTRWQTGRSGGDLDVTWTRHALERLHTVTAPPGIPSWKPLVAPGFAADLLLRLAASWGPGPYADRARRAVGNHLADIGRWTSRYHQLARDARGRTWVATHGEPHSDNQLLTTSGRYLVDWESLKLAPRERDLRVLIDAGAPVDADPDMLEMFDLEWRLDEISQYAVWFAAKHDDTEDDRIAFGALIGELTRE